jgi:hypothetical protein
MNLTEPLHRLGAGAVRVGIYLPIGLLSRLRSELATVDRARVERLVNELIDRGEQQLGRRETEVRTESNYSSDSVGVRSASRPSSSSAFESARVTIPHDPGDLPIVGYDSLASEEIVERLNRLTQMDLARVYGYERAHQDRESVVTAIEARIVDLPIPAYDSLTASQIRRRLDDLDAEQLERLRQYETATKNRSTVISKVDQLLE